MKITKANNGVTLVVLVITIIVMLIIAGVAVYTGTNDIDNAKDELLIAELGQVQHIIGENYIRYLQTKNEQLILGDKVSENDFSALSRELKITFIGDKDSFYRLNPTKLQELGIENCKNTYVVNYITGEIINETKLRTSSGQVLYSYLRKIFNNNDVTAF